MTKHDDTVGDDGLTAQERDTLRTPVSQVPPEHRHILVALHGKKSQYIQSENERIRREEKKQREENLYLKEGA